MLKIVEGLFYQNPHEERLLASHPAMVGVWRKCVSIVNDGAVMAPLLVDDRPRTDALASQSVEDLLMTTTSRSYGSLPWFAEPISEAELQARHGELGCKKLDAFYHLEVFQRLALYEGWEWEVVHPASFQDQQAGMLEELLKLLAPAEQLKVAAKARRVSLYDLQLHLRNNLLNRFTHHWVGDDGRVENTTKPIWQGGVCHKRIFAPTRVPATVA